MEVRGRLDATERGHGVDQDRHLAVDGRRILHRLCERLHDERRDAVAVNDDVIDDDVGGIRGNAFVVDVLEEVGELELEDVPFRRERPMAKSRGRWALLVVVARVFGSNQSLKNQL